MWFGTPARLTGGAISTQQRFTIRTPNVPVTGDIWSFNPVERLGGIDKTLPDRVQFFPNYPNPFNPATIIPFAVDTRGRVRLEVFDLWGCRVALLFEGPAEPGRTYTARFEGSHLSTGIYYCRLTSSGSVRVIRMMLLR